MNGVDSDLGGGRHIVYDNLTNREQDHCQAKEITVEHFQVENYMPVSHMVEVEAESW